MATTTDMVMDVDVVDAKGSLWSAMTSNTGTYERAQYNDLSAPGTSPTAGIGYIDQAIGGELAVRGDIFAWPKRGIRAARHLTMTGETLGGSPVMPAKIQGQVGANGTRSRTQVRVASALSEASQIPEGTSVMGAYLNPALAALLRKRDAS